MLKLHLKICKLLSSAIGNNNATTLRSLVPVRYYAVRKRFYRKTGILHSNGKYEVTLDQRKLKTPKGNLFTVESEPLALAISAEWDSQKEKINQSAMHLTTLCNTVIDNPNNLNKFDMVQHMVNYLDTDTILFQDQENGELYRFQQQEWDPVISWFNKKFKADVQKSRILDGPVISEKSKMAVRRHLMSYNFAAVNGFIYAVDTLKSIILTLACVEKFLNVEKAVLLSRLEEEFQLGRWGRVEWAHDLNQQELQARLAAAVLFIYFNSSLSLVKTKVIK